MLRIYFYLMRLHRPIPILIILYPTLWGIVAASSGWPGIGLLSIFILGVILMRTAGCVFNDIADRKFDQHVKRTAIRPLATGEIKPRHAFLLGCLLLIIAFVLVLLLNVFTIRLSFVALLLALTYPLFKRFFSMPQLALGFAFNFGIIMAYSAVQNHLPASAWILYASTIFWTIAYDTIYALADKPYDLKLGLKSSAITFGRSVSYAINICQLIMMLLLVIFGMLNHYNVIYYFALLISVFLFVQQAFIWRKGGINDCIKAFSSNHWQGLVILLGIFMQYV